MKNLTSEQFKQISDAAWYVWNDGGCVESLRDVTLRAVIDADRALNGWLPIEAAPKDTTPIDLWRNGERLANYRRVEYSKDNIFYDPVKSGVCCVRDATHWMPLPQLPKEESK